MVYLFSLLYVLSRYNRFRLDLVGFKSASILVIIRLLCRQIYFFFLFELLSPHIYIKGGILHESFLLQHKAIAKASDPGELNLDRLVTFNNDRFSSGRGNASNITFPFALLGLAPRRLRPIGLITGVTLHLVDSFEHGCLDFLIGYDTLEYLAKRKEKREHSTSIAKKVEARIFYYVAFLLTVES